LNIPQGKITQIPMGRVYDLEERTKNFAIACRVLVRKIPMDVGNKEDAKQLVRASGSVAANYIEANEGLSKKDFVYRIKVCKKESKESRLWLNLLHIVDDEVKTVRCELLNEAAELVKIFNAIIMRFPFGQ
jgi:four helix bundle protein